KPILVSHSERTFSCEASSGYVAPGFVRISNSSDKCVCAELAQASDHRHRPRDRRCHGDHPGFEFSRTQGGSADGCARQRGRAAGIGECAKDRFTGGTLRRYRRRRSATSTESEIDYGAVLAWKERPGKC